MSVEENVSVEKNKKVEKSKVPLFVRWDFFSVHRLLSGAFFYKDHFRKRILDNSQNWRRRRPGQCRILMRFPAICITASEPSSMKLLKYLGWSNAYISEIESQGPSTSSVSTEENARHGRPYLDKWLSLARGPFEKKENRARRFLQVLPSLYPAFFFLHIPAGSWSGPLFGRLAVTAI